MSRPVVSRRLIFVGCVAFAVALAAKPSVGEPADPSAAHAHATIRVDPELQLGELLRRTIAHDGGEAVVEAQRAAADALRSAARSPLSGPPVARAEFGADGVGGRGEGYRFASAGIDLPLWWPRQRGGRLAGADAAAARAQAAGPGLALEVAGWLRRALAELEWAEIELEAARRDSRDAERLSEIVARAVELGELPRRDLLLVEAEALDSRVTLLAAREEHAHSVDSYRLLTGIDRRPADWSEVEGDREHFARHPQIVDADARVQAAEAEVARLLVERWGQPAVAVGTEHERDRRPEAFSDRLMLGVRIPLGWGPDVASAIAQARVAAAEAGRDRARLERTLRQQLAEAEHRLSLARGEADLAQIRSRLRREHRQLVQAGFELGEVDLATLLRARRAAWDAEREHRVATVRVQLHVAERNQALGIVP